MKKIIFFMLVFYVFYFVQIETNAYSNEGIDYSPSDYSFKDDYMIDTRSLKHVQYSIFEIFSNVYADTENMTYDLNKDAFRFYNFLECVSSQSDLNQSKIELILHQSKIRYIKSFYTVENEYYRFNSLTMIKHYDYYESEHIENSNVNIYMDKIAFNQSAEHIFFSLFFSESYKGLIPNNLTEGSYNINSNLNNDYTYDQLTVNEHNNLHPLNKIELLSNASSHSYTQLVYLPDFGGTFQWVTSEYVRNFHGFKRLYNDEQSVYGYDSEYDPISPEISYSFPLLGQDIIMKIVDNDKAIILYGDNDYAFLTRDQHYKRNMYNITYDTIEQASIAGYENVFGNYFHQLGLYDGDVSNFSNLKFTKSPILDANIWPNSSYECVFDNDGLLDSDPLVMGTFNYYSGFNQGHYSHDVIPYLLWGNNQIDDSNWFERIAWDSGSRLQLGWQHLRKESLYNAYENSVLVTKPFSSYELLIISSRVGELI